MQTMKTVFATAFILLATLCHAQTFVAGDEGSTVMKEYIDGKLWVYRNFNDIVVGTNCSEVKDSYGKYYQINILLHILANRLLCFVPKMYWHICNVKTTPRNLKFTLTRNFKRKSDAAKISP